MTMVGAETRRWTRRRWLAAVLGILALQVVAVALLVRPMAPPPIRPGFATRVSLVPPNATEVLFESVGLVDPALFALPSIHGFSAAWLRYPLLDPPSAVPSVAAEWLRLTPESLGGQLTRYLAENTLRPPLLVEEPLPPLPRYEASVISERVAVASRLRVVGDLTARPMLDAIVLPSWAHSDLVSNTVIRASVDASGLCFSAAIVARSGLASADDYALHLIEGARFQPAMPEKDRSAARHELTWGTFVFLWHTRPISGTNVPTTAP
jgi:hypothetical protein